MAIHRWGKLGLAARDARPSGSFDGCGARPNLCWVLPESFVPEFEKQNFPLPTKLYMACVPQVMGTPTDILQKGTVPLTHELKKLNYRRGQGRVCDLLVVVPSFLFVYDLRK